MAAPCGPGKGIRSTTARCKIRVTILGDRPDHGRDEGTCRALPEAVMPTLTRIGLLAALLALPGCAIANSMSGVSEARDIQAKGQLANAVILELWDTGITLNDDPVVGLRVKVDRGDGAPYEATIPKSVVSRLHVPQVQPGQTVPVYVDPQDPSRVALGLYDLRR
jgi:hypothetical protein